MAVSFPFTTIALPRPLPTALLRMLRRILPPVAVSSFAINLSTLWPLSLLLSTTQLHLYLPPFLLAQSAICPLDHGSYAKEPRQCHVRSVTVFSGVFPLIAFPGGPNHKIPTSQGISQKFTQISHLPLYFSTWIFGGRFWLPGQVLALHIFLHL